MESYEIPKAGKLSLNADKNLQCNERFITDHFKNIGVTPKSLNDDMRILEDWYKKQPHLPDDPLINLRLFQYFFVSGMSVEKIKKKVDNYYSLINKFPEFLKNRDPCDPVIATELKNTNCTVIPKMTDQHHRILLFSFKEPRVFDAVYLIKTIFMLADYRMYNEVAIGDHWLFDMSNISLKNVMDISAVVVKALVIFINCYGLKVKGIHFTSVPHYAMPLINLMRKIAKQKISERVYIYNKFEDIYDVFPKSIFPRDLGGDEQSCDEIHDIWVKTLQSPQWRQWFIARDDLCADESKRIGPFHYENPNMYGVDGSFKTLAID